MVPLRRLPKPFHRCHAAARDDAMGRLRLILPLIAFAVILTPGPPRAGEAPVVENPGHGLWDDTAGKTFHLLENLVLGSEEGEDAFGRISGLVVDSRGRMIILDGGYELVLVYDPESMEMDSIGRKGEGPGEFNAPTAIGIDADDRVYVASRDGRVAIFSPDGGLLDEFRHKLPGGAPAWSLKAGAGGVYLASLDTVDHKIVHRYDAQHRYLGSFSDSWAIVKPMDTTEELATCGGTIDIGPDGTVYFAQFTPYEIRKFSADGRLLLTIHRESDFMLPPRIERTGDSFRIQSSAGSGGVLVLPDGKLMHLTMCFPDRDARHTRTIVDIFDTDGKLLKSRTLGGRVAVRFIDDKWRAYSIEERVYPLVVRYEIRLP
jgi:hypothetical protein